MLGVGGIDGLFDFDGSGGLDDVVVGCGVSVLLDLCEFDCFWKCDECEFENCVEGKW